MRKASGWLAGVAVGASLLLAACGGDDQGAATASTTTVSGTAAVGAPMAAASIQLRCRNGVFASTTADAVGAFAVTVPSASLPCAISATPAVGAVQFSVVTATGNGTANVSPLTSLALALAGTAPDAGWFAALDDAGLLALAAALNTAVNSLNTALSGYGLPVNFNPFTSALQAATAGQAGNDYDRLLEQFQAALEGSADPSFANLLSTAAGGTLALPTPPRTPGASSAAAFFTTFAGDYTLKVTSVVSEGASAGAAALFPLNSARVVSIQANGDVSFAAVGRTITFSAADYNQDFIGSATTLNEVRYRTKDAFQWLELYITYDPATGELRLDPAGFLLNDEGLATLKGPVFVPTSSPPPATCSSGDDKLVFTNGPADFCGFTRSASANAIPNYFQFTSAAGVQGVTYVKFDMNSDDSAVLKVTIENDDYAFGCGGALPTCTGVTVSSGSGYKQFTLNGTALAVINGASQGMTVNGLLIHPLASPPPAPSGTLGGALQSVYAGDYVLKCGSPVQTFALTINQDGSSTLDGQPLVDATHPGFYVLRNRSDFGRMDLTITADSPLVQVVLGFNDDGSFFPISVSRNGNDFMCAGNAGQSAPATTAQARTSFSGVADALSRVDTLSCTTATGNESRTLTLASDGSVQLGAQSFTDAQLNRVVHNLAFNAFNPPSLEYGANSTSAGKLIISFDASLEVSSISYGGSTTPNTAYTCVP